MTKAHTDSNQDSEMLDEYDFSKGFRGKYYEAYRNNNLRQLREIQFLVDTKGMKIGALVDLNEHKNLLDNIVEQFDSKVGLQYIINHQGNQIALLLNFKKHLPIWKKLYDCLIVEQNDLEKSAEL